MTVTTPDIKAPETQVIKHINPSKKLMSATIPSDWNIRSDGDNIIAEHELAGCFKGTMEEFNALRRG
jgi:hypothetical protein